MVHCGSIDDVYAYEKMKHKPRDSPPHGSSPTQRPTSKQQHHRKAGSFSETAVPMSMEAPPPLSAKLGGSKPRSMSFRWITRQSSAVAREDVRAGDSSSLSVSAAACTSSASQPQPQPQLPRKPRDSTKPRIGLVDILLGYHSLLQASPILYPATLQKRQFYPTIGFLDNPEYGGQR